VSLLSSYCTHCIGQQLVLYLALLSCSLFTVKLHVILHVVLFVWANKEGRKKKEGTIWNSLPLAICSFASIYMQFSSRTQNFSLQPSLPAFSTLHPTQRLGFSGPVADIVCSINLLLLTYLLTVSVTINWGHLIGNVPWNLCEKYFADYSGSHAVYHHAAVLGDLLLSVFDFVCVCASVCLQKQKKLLLFCPFRQFRDFWSNSTPLGCLANKRWSSIFYSPQIYQNWCLSI